MRYAADTKLSQDEVLRRAAKHFGDLGTVSKDVSSVCLESTDGYVSISTCKSDAKGKKTHLEIETREYDSQVTSFIRSL